ncbi:MAG: hypothetical protein QG580_56 [Patescibacteria group bacterium]|nr:hypothetical protein [Patescibacteria group bacterium]
MENSFEVPKKKEIVRAEDIDSFIEDIERYDREHSSSRKMGGFLAAMIMSSMEDKEGIENIKKDIENSITIDDLIKRNINTLQKIGLDLESPNKEGDIDMNEQYVTGEVMIHLLDRDSYIDYLKSLEPGKISPSQEKLLEMITNKISSQIDREYNLEDSKGDERLLEIFSGLREIVSEYERLGLSKNVYIFKEYLEYLNSGYLKEYILVKKSGVFEEVGSGFNLSTFQIDSSPEMYKKYWKFRFFNILDRVKQNPEAKDLVEKMIEYAKKSIEFAEKDNEGRIIKMESSGKNISYYVNLKPVILEVKDMLYKL